MSIALVMPAYNEGDCIESVAKSWLKILDSIPGYLIIVNDGSKDKTADILNALALKETRLKVIHQQNAGHGAAVIRGYDEALKLGVSHVFQTDSDDQFKPDDFWKLWQKKDISPFVTGYRKKRHDAFHRLVITRIIIVLNTILFGSHIKDANIPFRLMRADFLTALLKIMPLGVFAPNIFLTVLAVKSGANLFEIPIVHEERKTGQVSIIKWKLIKICFRCVKELFQFRVALVKQSSVIKNLRAQNA